MAHHVVKHSKLVPLSAVLFAAVGAVGLPAIAVADPLPYGADTCIQGFVWREAGPGDVVCVTPAVRSSTAQDNQAASGRVDPNGAYGPTSCKQGFVWREAFSGDQVCVTPQTRTQAANDNGAAASRKAANAAAPAAPAGPPPCVLQNPAPGLIPSGLGGLC